MSSFDIIEQATVELVDDAAQFFAPVSSDLIDGLLSEYQDYLCRIDRLALMIDGEQDAIYYFLEGNADRHSRYMPAVKELFGKSGAIKALNSAYWSKTLGLTDVYDAMPQARRDEWNKSITEMTTPDFTEAAVRPTIESLLASRAKFFSERVDGIFRGLSNEHVTNAPEGFGKRMIVGYMLSYGSISHSRAGLINDLRCVIAKFMGRDDPKYTASEVLIKELYKRTGEWVVIDGGTLRIRVYKKGTAHLEVHPDMAWRLNQVLASLYPMAIPSEFRTKPKKKAKDFLMIGRPLPFSTLELLAAGLRNRIKITPANGFSFEYSAKQHSAVYDDACHVLEAIGGTKNKDGDYEFDYPIEQVLREVIVTGCLPDQKAHQFYPTPEKLACIAVDLAEIGPQDLVLEPSAGQGGIADLLPKDRTTCIEISPLHCAVLRAKGFKTVEADFITWADQQPYATPFDVVVMNPPFSDGRAKLHTEYASIKVRSGGRLVAILPASMRNKDFLGAGWTCEWSSVYEREFAGTSAAVVILKAVRAA